MVFPARPRRGALAFAALALALLAGALLIPSPAGALPPGSYRDSCRDCYTEGRELRCQCRDRDGHWIDTKIRYQRCDWAIMNDNGHLACEDARHAPPPGTWRKTCRDWRRRGDTLRAECRNRYGDWVRTSLNLRECRGEVGNDNGNLVCAGSRQEAPGGTWRESCRRWRRRGDTLWAECRNRQGNWVNSSLNLRRCGQPVNCDGRLTCGRCP